MKVVGQIVLALAAITFTVAYSGNGAQSTTMTSNANCERETYTLEITSSNFVFDKVDENANQTYITQLQLEFVTSLPAAFNLSAPSNFSTLHVHNGRKTVSNTHQLSGVLCTPKFGAKDDSTIQLLVHGIGFDSSYWNFNPGDETYSYVYQAAQAGYSTFRYDRLGTGQSAHPDDAYNIVQAPTDLAILTKFASMLRSGRIGNKKYTKIIGVGHSYGSAQVNALTSMSPKAVDEVVLTGFTANSSSVPLYLASAGYTSANAVFPDRFSKLPNAYLTTVSVYTGQLNFFYFPYYTATAATLARSTEQPVTQGVLFTFAGLVMPAPSFTGPVHVVTGAQDFIFCLSNCYAVPPGSGLNSILDTVKTLYPATSRFSTAVPPNTGHGISAHLSAPQVYADIQRHLAGGQSSSTVLTKDGSSALSVIGGQLIA